MRILKCLTQFDGIKTEILGPLVPVPDGYDDLRWGGFTARNDGINLVRAKSPPNAAGTSTVRAIQNGGQPANITRGYPSSKAKYYTAIKTFVSCSTVSAGVVTPPGTGPVIPATQTPQPCQILFSGVNSKGAAIHPQTCSYSGTELNPAMQECFFGPQFVDTVTLYVTIDRALATPLTTVASIDNFQHKNFY